MLRRVREFESAEFTSPSREEVARLAELRNLRENRGPDADRILTEVAERDAAVDTAFRDAYTEINGPTTDPNYKGNVTNARQIGAFLKPGPENAKYNEDVMRVLSDVETVDGRNVFRNQAKAAEIIKNAKDELLRETAPETLDTGDFYALRAKYPALEAQYMKFHAINDLTKPNGPLNDAGVQEVYPPPQNRADMFPKQQLVMGACDHMRAQLIADGGFNERHKLHREATSPDMHAAHEKATRNAGTCLGGASNLEGVRGKIEEMRAEAGARQADPEQRERVSLRDLDGGRQERQPGASRRRPPNEPEAARAAAGPKK
jgi:hypothetical protein